MAGAVSLTGLFLLFFVPASLSFQGVGRPAGAALPVIDVASYAIQVSLEPETKRLTGRQVITYTNVTAAPIPDLVFHLYLNAFRDVNSVFLQESGPQHRGYGWDEDHPGWIRVSDLRLVDGPALALAEIEDGTLARAELPEPIKPGQTVRLALDFEAQLPRVFARTGYAGDFFMVGQWFPKLGVWQEGAWNAYPFHANAEFYADFGDYEVTITLPAAYVTGGTGLLVSASEEAGGFRTVRYRAEDVIDFAWTASPHFLKAIRQVGETELLYLYLPEHESTVARALDAAEAALTYFSEWYGPYPYARLTVVDVPDQAQGAGGMEYPTLVTAGPLVPLGPDLGDRTWDRTLELVVVHEIGHQWWQSMVAFNEAEEPWLDEGLTDYSTLGLMERVYGVNTSFLNAGNLRMGYLDMRRAEYINDPHTPMVGLAWELGSDYGVAAYAKPLLALRTLENVLGEETMGRIMKTFFQRYRFAHPTTEDFRAVAEEAAGQELDWFFDGLVYGDGGLNYAVTALTEHSVTVVRQGELRLPAELLVAFSDGTTVLEPWSGEETEKTFAYPDRPPIRSARIDPDRKLVVDLRWSDNGLARDLQSGPWLALVTRLLAQFQHLLLALGGL